MKDQAGPIREEGRGAGSRALGVVVLLTRSSTSVGSQVRPQPPRSFTVEGKGGAAVEGVRPCE